MIFAFTVNSLLSCNAAIIFESSCFSVFNSLIEFVVKDSSWILEAEVLASGTMDSPDYSH